MAPIVQAENWRTGTPIVSPTRHEEFDPESLVGKFTAIAATPHADLWEISGPILLLGAWCEPALQQLPGITYAVLPNRWDNRSLVAPAEAYCWDVFTYCVPQLAQCLNRIHNTQHPVSYWEFLLAPWLLDTIHALYDRYLLACDARRLAPDAILSVPDTTLQPPSTTARALDRLISDTGNLGIFSLVFRALGLPVIRKPFHQQLPIGSRSLRSTAESVLRKAKRVAHRWLARPSGMRLLVSVSHMNIADVVRMAMQVPGLRVPIQSALADEEPFSTDWTRRESLRQLSARSEFERMFVQVLPDLMPVTMVENYENVVRSSHASFGDRTVPVVFTYFQEPALEFTARARAAGVSVSMYQHGGGYGQYRTYPIERYHVAKGHTFLSWGWLGSSIKPLPSPHLSRLRDSHRGSHHIVLIEVCMPKYVHRIHSKPQGHDGRLDAHMAEFVDNLVPALRASVMFKPVPDRFESVRHPTLEALARQCSKPSSSAYAWMRKARLAVVTYPETSFIEALTLNVPTIGLWDFSLYEMRPEAQPYFDALQKSGIIYSDPKEAAQKVADVYECATSWWNSEEVQSARLAFLERFGLASRDWRHRWVRYLKELAASSRQQGIE